MKLYVARHGQTDYNQQKKFYGSSDVPLNANGRKDAAKLADKFEALPLELIVTSDLKRARQTARTIIATHPESDSQLSSKLEESHFGAWEGLNADEIQATFPEDWQNWLDDPFHVSPTNGENFQDFNTRVLAGLKNILSDAASNDHVLLVAHLGVLRVINQSFFPESNFWEQKFLAGTYSVYQLDEVGRCVGVVYDV